MRPTVRRNLLLLLFVAAIGGFYFVESDKPPKESDVIGSLNRHRPEYEQLRDMLVTDEKLVRVAAWGVETTDSASLGNIPPEGSSLETRFHRYLSLLKTIGAKAAYRTHASPPEAGVLVWSSGFAGDTRHVVVCWTEKAPAEQVSSLDAFYKSPKPRHPVYQHIDGNWYIWVDW